MKGIFQYSKYGRWRNKDRLPFIILENAMKFDIIRISRRIGGIFLCQYLKVI